MNDQLALHGERPSPLSADGWSAAEWLRLPNVLSLSRIVLAGLFPLTLRRVEYSLALLAAAGATDLLDGWYARRRHQATAFGAFLDGVADKVFGFAVVLTLLAARRLSFSTMLALETRDLGEGIIGLQLLARRRALFGRKANVVGKIATLLQYAALAAVLCHRPHASRLAGLAGIGGVAASLAYWRRDVARP